MTAVTSGAGSRVAGVPGDPGMVRTSGPVIRGRAAVLLDALMGLSVLAALSYLLALLDDGLVPRALVGGWLVVMLAMVALWVARRVVEHRSQTPARRLVLTFVALATLGVFVAGSGSWALFLMALLVLVTTFSPRAGVLLVATLLLAQVALFTASGRDWVQTVQEVAFTAWLFGFGLVLAWLVAEHVNQREQIRALLAETRRGVATEVELVLADERTRSARDLHDGLGHRLSLVSMALQYAERMRERDPDRAWAQVTSARVQAGEALTTMRRWVRALSPVRVQGASVAESLEAIADSFRGTGLTVTVDAPTGPALDRFLTLFVHRFVQEGLTNVLRHSAATRVEVRCGSQDGLLSLGVLDDGSPGAPDRAAPVSGFGLRTLQERAADIGGSVDVAWSAYGLDLTARLPLTGHQAP